jgi:hypothetical protein
MAVGVLLGVAGLLGLVLGLGGNAAAAAAPARGE